MNLLCVFLACSIGFEICFAQSFDKTEVNNYLEDVANAISDKLTSYGLSNLPDVDVKIYYNLTDSYNITGNLYMDDGFVMDMASLRFTQDDQSSGNSVSLKKATIRGNMKFNKLEFFRDFHFEADEGSIPDQTYGGVIIRPDEFYFSFSISQNLINNNVTYELGNTIQGKTSRESLEFNPKNMFTNRLKKGRPYGEDLFPKLPSLWIPILNTFFEETIKTKQFPSLHFYFSRIRKNQ